MTDDQAETAQRLIKKIRKLSVDLNEAIELAESKSFLELSDELEGIHFEMTAEVVRVKTLVAEIEGIELMRSMMLSVPKPWAGFH